jgi:hypothetical protein
MLARRVLFAVLLNMVLIAPSVPTASADDLCVASRLGLERQLRQLYLDLLARPPTVAEYQAVQAKGSITDEDIRALMEREEFYARMKGYHRALLRANVSASVPQNGDTRLNTTNDGEKPLELRGNPASGLRGKNGAGCDHFIAQDDCKNAALQQDPQSEGPAADKVCRDPRGVPLPVSFDYDDNLYRCTALTGATSCADAVTKGLLQAKQIFFCDMRRTSMGLVPSLCLPDPGKPTTAALSREVLDEQQRIVAFENPTPAPGVPYTRLDRCTLALTPKNGVVGTFVAQRGCVEREGYVKVAPPFWSAATEPVTACAIEAQARDVNPATLASCDTPNFLNDRSCGCGANFRRCESGDRAVFEARVDAINEEPLRIVDSVLRRNEDYFHVLTTRRSFVNGVLASLYRQDQATGALAITPPLQREAIPELPYASTDWVEYLRADSAAGVLTTPAWLYRFPTQRSRVSEFYDAFLCTSFVPPLDAVTPDPEDSCNRENNLAKRCGCNYCHATIEPVGAHWGRYGERNAQYLDPLTFPKFDPKCRDCALAGNTTCDNDCNNYVMQAYDGDGANSLGMLKTYLYRTASDEANIQGGPKLLVERMLQTGDLEQCAVKRVWREMLGRPLSGQEEELYLGPLVDAFIDARHDFKALIQHVVTTDAYRRID